MSEFHVEVVRLGDITKHPDADRLSITQVYGGYPVIIKTGDFKPGDLAVYIPVDALVPLARPEFSFLDDGKGRIQFKIKARRLRGIFSMGLLIPAPTNAKEGDDLQAFYGIEKWLPEAEQEPDPNVNNDPKESKRQRQKALTHFEFWLRFVTAALVLSSMVSALFLPMSYGVATLPFILVTLFTADKIRLWNINRNKTPSVPVYDIDGLRKYKSLLEEGEEVHISEKIHGASSKYVHTGKRFFIGSRTQFRAEDGNDWHVIAQKYDLKSKLAKHPNLVLFGEVYGAVQKGFPYGVPKGERMRFMAFDALDLKTGRYLGVDAFLALCKELDVPVVPTLYRGPWKTDLMALADGYTTVPGANHVREGIVVKPVVERVHPRLGRVILKLHGEGFLVSK